MLLNLSSRGSKGYIGAYGILPFGGTKNQELHRTGLFKSTANRASYEVEAHVRVPRYAILIGHKVYHPDTVAGGLGVIFKLWFGLLACRLARNPRPTIYHFT